MKKLHPAFAAQLDVWLGAQKEDFLGAMELPAQRSIRLHPEKTEGIAWSKATVPWHEKGYYLPESTQIAYDPWFHAGAFYVQESSSMALQAIVDALAIAKDAIWLDACAAPGGKSTLLASAFKQGLVVANEALPARQAALIENVQKWGTGNLVITQNDLGSLGALGPFFDAILLDAPCSGEGMFRKSEEATKQWSPELVLQCAERQKRLLADVWKCLKPGGYLIYSTCTFNTLENEENIRWWCQQSAAQVATPNVDALLAYKTNIADVDAFRFGFHHRQGEGLFMTVLQKPHEATNSRLRKAKPMPATKHCSMLQNPKSWICLQALAPETIACREWHYSALSYLKEHLRLRYLGIMLGRFQGKDFRPHEALALTTHLKKEAFPWMDLGIETLLLYLTLQSLPNTYKRSGWQLITAKGIGLGWVKAFDGRMNNYFPSGWRLRKAAPLEYIAHQLFAGNSSPVDAKHR